MQRKRLLIENLQQNKFIAHLIHKETNFTNKLT